MRHLKTLFRRHLRKTASIAIWQLCIRERTAPPPAIRDHNLVMQTLGLQSSSMQLRGELVAAVFVVVRPYSAEPRRSDPSIGQQVDRPVLAPGLPRRFACLQRPSPR
jgi:hypothetical protein